MNRAQAALAADARANAKLTQAQREEMVERFLRGETRDSVAAAFGVDPTLPALRAYTWGFIDRRTTQVVPQCITEEGRAWLKAREAARATPSPSKDAQE